MNIVLLITGCISPNRNQDYLVICDQKVRLQQYVDSIIFYIKHSLFRNIVFCENSNFKYDDVSKLELLASQYNKNFEWISFAGETSKISTFGKGYGEDEIVDYALENSLLLAKCESFAKVTGRLILQNVDEMIKPCSLKENYFLRDIYRHHTYAVDTRFYVVNKDFFCTNLRGCYKKDYSKAETQALEDVYFLLLRGRYKPFYHFYDFTGVSGGNGRDYSKMPMSMKWIINLFIALRIYNCLFVLLFIYRRALRKFLHIDF